MVPERLCQRGTRTANVKQVWTETARDASSFRFPLWFCSVSAGAPESNQITVCLGRFVLLSLVLCACMCEKPLDTTAASAGVTQMPVEKGASLCSNSTYF